MILLASQSERRQQLLRQLGVEFELCITDIDETPKSNESAEETVVRLAYEKALAAQATHPNRPILAADTLVVLAGQCLGKPASFSDAKHMLRQLSDNTHQVMTAVCVLDAQGRAHQALNVSEVTFRAISDDEIERYWHTGEPADKAGAYGLQGYGAIFVSSIRGSYSGIIGLPLYETDQLLGAINIPRWQTRSITQA